VSSHCSLLPLVAARQAVGIAGTDRRHVVNLTQLRRNKRNRADKKGGRKRPRTADVDVVAAPDADAGVGAALLGSPGPAPSPAPLICVVLGLVFMLCCLRVCVLKLYNNDLRCKLIRPSFQNYMLCCLRVFISLST